MVRGQRFVRGHEKRSIEPRSDALHRVHYDERRQSIQIRGEPEPGQYEPNEQASLGRPATARIAQVMDEKRRRRCQREPPPGTEPRDGGLPFEFRIVVVAAFRAV